MACDAAPPKPLPLTRGGALDALRFLAAFFMVVYHYSQESPVKLQDLHPLFSRGYLATDFFLIVSGYVLGRIYGERVAAEGGMSVGGFFLRRAQRLVPAHLIMVGAFLALVAVTSLLGVKAQHPEYLQWADLPGELFLVQALGVPGGHGWNSPTWTLSALLVCYALFPLIWRAQARVRPAAVLAATVALLMIADGVSSRWVGRRIYEFPSEVGVVRAMPLFLVGVALARVSQSVYIHPGLARTLALFAAGTVVAIQFVGAYDFTSVALIALLVLAAAAIPMTRPSYLLEKGALVSFALFITNEFVRNIYFGVEHVLAGRLALGVATGWALWWAALACAVGFAVAFHYLVDMPTQRWIKRRRKPLRSLPSPRLLVDLPSDPAPFIEAPPAEAARAA